MLNRRAVLSSSVAALLLAPAVAAAGGAIHAPIIGGDPVAAGQFPTVVALRTFAADSSSYTLCTGTLIAPEWILTAAHCIDPKLLQQELGLGTAEEVAANTEIYFDVTDLDARPRPGRMVRARETFANPYFSTSRLGDNDIGLVHLAQAVTDRPPTPINRSHEATLPGIKVTMVGYGMTDASNDMSTGVEYALFDRLSIQCSGLGQGLADSNLLCYSQADNRGKCQGDSGGPSFLDMGGVQTIVGITSFGDSNCALYGADTRVDAEIKFVDSHVPEIRCAADDRCVTECGNVNLPLDPDCPSCTTDDQCGDGQVCDNTRCAPAPFTEGGLGSPCNGPDACAVGYCLGGANDMLCTSECTPGAADACPDGFDCVPAGGTGACRPAAEPAGCCSTSRGAGTTSALFGLLVAGALGRRRRRRA